MGSATREKGVLKLVHPGRHVEYHRHPITAAEVMKKNPRHCVARPDVFKYPWIVVRPESVLMPGKVFFIVPNLTIHSLLKARGYFDQASSQSPSPNTTHGYTCIPKRNSSIRSSAGRTPKHQFGNISKVGESLEEQDFDGTSTDTSHIKSNICENTVHKSPVDSSSALALPESKTGDQIVCHKQDRKLNSCIRKEDSIRRWLTLKVTFDLTTTTTRAIELPS